MSYDDETRKIQVEVYLAEIETVLHAYRTGSLGLQQLVTRLARAVERLSKAAGDRT